MLWRLMLGGPVIMPHRVEWCGFPDGENFLKTCICFDRIHERKGQTDIALMHSIARQ